VSSFISESSYFGSYGPSGSCFIDNLHNERKTRKASFCKICGKVTGDFVEVEELSVPSSETTVCASSSCCFET